MLAITKNTHLAISDKVTIRGTKNRGFTKNG